MSAAETTSGGPSARVDDWDEITDLDELTALVGEPTQAVRDKVRPALHDLDRRWLAASPFCVLATADADGRLDASPKGDPAGRLVHVIDDHTLVIAERPGNKRVDGYRNVLVNPHVGLLFLIPGRGDTLRVNGRARLVRDAPFFADLEVRGRRPLLALVVEVEEVFHHCAKAFLRSQLWKPETWDPDALASRAEIAHQLDRRDASLDELRAYYDEASYSRGLY
ncbi:hypothetical protein FHX74_003633 [Friedmanniella endophytica]|uniref:Pyridoxamine 5'-phosphate oxidase N-terminal domain-containing protein n=1 Tax=Microlunatus kandeliicorticis TaxID=1759536 RepID=A0A7W3IVG4_9ACTN|nr:pyridoxamine 5'-phosphate oxidase family protein [Microlunatus kandeliicorticis]MBA8795992.1 hypothetical protein [Microlunatus kandeliicorticis]